MPFTPPAHCVDASDHPAQRTLDLLDAELVLRFNKKLERYEVWRRLMRGQFSAIPTDVDSLYVWEFMTRCEQGGRFIAPGEWLRVKLARRDARYVGAEAAAAAAIAEIDAHNAQLEAQKRAAQQEQIAEIAHEYAPIIGRELADDPLFAKPFAVPDSYPEGRTDAP
ncbi:MAG: hypothetical protein ACRDGB_05725 [Candidatus Limnocylindria bacterium]